MRNVNESLKGIDLTVIFRNILWENDKVIILLTAFYISYKSDVKTFLLWFINNCPKSIC